MKIQLPGWGKSFPRINVYCVCKWDQVEKKHCADSNAPEPVSEDVNFFCCSTSCSVRSVDYHRAQAVWNWFHWLPVPVSTRAHSNLSRLKCGPKIHSACLLGWDCGMSHPTLCHSFFPTGGRQTWKQRSMLHSTVPPSGWLWHTKVCSRLRLLVAEWYSVPTACHSPEPNPLIKAWGRRWAFNSVRLVIVAVSGSCHGKDPARSSYITLSHKEVVCDLWCAFSSLRKRADFQWYSTEWLCAPIQREEPPEEQL